MFLIIEGADALRNELTLLINEEVKNSLQRLLAKTLEIHRGFSLGCLEGIGPS